MPPSRFPFLGDKRVTVISQGKIVHAIHLRGLVGWVEFADDVERAQSVCPILRLDQLLGALVGALRAAEIGRGGQCGSG